MRPVCVHTNQKGSIPGVHLCNVKLGSREAMHAVYERLDALGLEATVVSHVCPLHESVARAIAQWTDCPWYQAAALPDSPDESGG